MKTNVISIVVMALTLSVAGGCKSGDDPKTPQTGHAISFLNYDSGLGRGVTALSDSWDNFYVIGHKWIDGDPTQITVIPGYRVDYGSGDWTYENPALEQYLKFWDLSAGRYRFSAVAPAPDFSESAAEGYRGTTVSVEPDGEIKILNARGNMSTGDFTNSSHSPEWMVAQTERVAAPLSDTDVLHPSQALHDLSNPLTTFTDDVPLCFHHVMAKVDFLVFATTPIILKSFKVEVSDGQNLITLGNYSTVDHWTDLSSPASHKPQLYCDYIYLDGKTVSDNQERPTLLASHVQIPQEWADAGREFKITFTTTSDVVYTGYIVIDETNNETNSWLENNHYRYRIKIVTGEGDVQVILFAVDMDTWKWKEGSEQEEVQTDW